MNPRYILRNTFSHAGVITNPGTNKQYKSQQMNGRRERVFLNRPKLIFLPLLEKANLRQFESELFNYLTRMCPRVPRNRRSLQQ